ncbi:hypothetical protein EMMF5_004488 [Cystobasidiomycetes sp. EMM_F5]
MPSDKEIIAQNAQELENKSRWDRPEKFSDRDTAMSDESGISDSRVASSFEGATFSTGRTGQTGGGENPQLIPPEEGGEGRSGTSSAIYEDARGGKEDIKADIARNDPSVNRQGDNVRREGGVPGARPPQELTDDQLEGARSG